MYCREHVLPLLAKCFSEIFINEDVCSFEEFGVLEDRLLILVPEELHWSGSAILSWFACTVYTLHLYGMLLTHFEFFNQYFTDFILGVSPGLRKTYLRGF